MKEPSALSASLGALRYLPRMFAQVWATSPALTLASIGLRIVRSLLPVAILYVGKLIIDEVVAQSGQPGPDTGFMGWIESGRLSHVGLLLAIEFGLAICSDLLGRAGSLVDALLSELYSNSVSVKLMDHAAALDLSLFESADQQDRLERARRQTAGRSNLIALIFGQAQDFLTLLSLAAGLIAFAPWLILLLALALVPSLMGELHFNREGYRLNFMKTPERRRIDYIRQLGSSVEMAKEIKLFDLGPFLIRRFDELASDMFASNKLLAVRRAFWGGLFSTFSAAAYYFAYAIIVWRTIAGDFSIGDLAFLSGSFLRLRSLLESFLLGFSMIAGQVLYLEDLFSFFDTTPDITSPAKALPAPSKIQTGFVFEDVGFRYPGTENWAVRHLNFELRAGEILALVGENGAGKTTIVKLLTRLYDPDEGRVLLDGHDLREYDLDGLRGMIGVIFQDFGRFHFTAGDNIALGRVEYVDDDVRIRAAASQSLADKVIEKLPDGYDQILGKRFSTGIDVSGGEWQKIAIARAYMREAEALVLDEPTAALDARAEFEVFQRFKDLSEGKTALIISHRFSTVRLADRILVLEGGRVVENGTHEELLAAGQRYAALYELQASGYK